MKKTLSITICCIAVVMVMTASPAKAQLVIGDSIGIDFGTTGTVFGTDSGVAPAAGTNFNEFNTQTADGETASFSGTLIYLDGTEATNVGFSVTNNMGKDSGGTGIAGDSGPAPFDDVTIGVDNYGAANVGNPSRADGGVLAADGNIVLTFTGLDDSLLYEVTGGYLHGGGNNNFNTTWDVDGQSATTDNESGLADAGYVTLSDLCTDGSGNLEITVTRSVQLFIAGMTLEATAVKPEGCILGDVSMNGVVDFNDIPPFVGVLLATPVVFQCEADCDENGIIDFNDIPFFVDILLNP